MKIIKTKWTSQETKRKTSKSGFQFTDKLYDPKSVVRKLILSKAVSTPLFIGSNKPADSLTKFRKWGHL